MRIFISHGTNTNDPADRDFLNALAAELGAPGASGNPHTVLLDRMRLNAGDDWEGILHDFLAECQAAVLVLSERALTRPWVLKEATILSYRKAREKSAFPFFCVVMPDTTMAAVQALPAFNALGLDAQQAFAPGTAPTDVAAWVKTKLADIEVPDATPLDRLQNELANRISLTQNTQALEQVCEHWLGEMVTWFASTERGTQRARVIARAIARGHLGQLKTLAGMTKALRGTALNNENCERVLDLSASLWVDADVAGRLGAFVVAAFPFDDDPASTAPLAVALNSDVVEHGMKMAVWRCQLPDTAESVYWVAGGLADNTEDALIAAFRREYRTAIGKPNLPDKVVDATLAARTEPVFFVIPMANPDRALLRALRKTFPRAVFIAHTGSALLLADAVPDHLLQLAPGLDTEAEIAQFADFESAREFLR